MSQFVTLSVALLLSTVQLATAQETASVSHFDKVIISPHIQVTFIKGEKDAVAIQNSTVSREKIHIESIDKTLRVYLEGAKEVTKSEKKKENGYKTSKSIYTGTVLTVTVFYTDLQVLSIRGEETILLKSKLDQDNFDLRIYGESKVHLDQAQLKKFNTTIYGESFLEVKSGNIAEQKFIVYGEAQINTIGVDNLITRATLYGEAKLKLKVSEQISISSFGEAEIGYKGNPEIKKRINIGGLKIYKLDSDQ